MINGLNGKRGKNETANKQRQMRIQTFNQRLETVVYNLINTTNIKQCIDKISSLGIVYGNALMFIFFVLSYFTV